MDAIPARFMASDAADANCSTAAVADDGAGDAAQQYDAETGAGDVVDSILVMDNGSFPEVAARLAHETRVGYFAPWIFFQPMSATHAIGYGLKDVKREDYKWDVIDKYDVVFFPDVGEGDFQEYLVRMGKPVFGAKKGEWLELDRWRLRQWMEKQGMPVALTSKVQGTEALREELKRRGTGKYVKVDRFRSDMETFHHDKPAITDTWLTELENRLGPMKQEIKFMVEDEIPGKEWGYDGFSIDGEFPDVCCYGIELKGDCYLGKVVDYSDLPKPLRVVNDKIAPLLKEEQYRAPLSTEVRITAKRESYLIDPCCRLGSPPGESMMEAFSNWGEIICAGARGNMVKPKPTAKYLAQLQLYSTWGEVTWLSVHFPEEIKKWVKIWNLSCIDSQCYSISEKRGLTHKIGAVVGLGNTMKEAIELCKQRTKQLEVYALEVSPESFDKAIVEIEESKDVGITW